MSGCYLKIRENLKSDEENAENWGENWGEKKNWGAISKNCRK